EAEDEALVGDVGLGLLLGRTVLDLEAVALTVLAASKDAVLARRGPILVVDAEDRKVGDEESKEPERLAVAERQLLHELEGEERAVGEDLGLENPAGQTHDRGQ